MAGGKIDILVEPDTKGFDGKLASGLKGSSGIAGKVGKGIALALAAGTAVAGFGLSAVIAKGREYEASLNDLQAVTQATAIDMRKVGQTAKDLGADMSLPATSAADAASAMVELAKGGLSVDEAMKAAKGTLQLAAAAQIDGAQAAEIQSSALNAFGLKADQAGRVADVLANTANAAAGSIVDIGNSMKFVAPVSAALGVSIEDTAAAIGLLANQGIKGEQAGTSLRGILASLASPSAQAKKALTELGVAAFDQQGKFIGLRAFTDQLAKAKGRLSDAAFAAASSTAFGNEGFTAANALAAEGAVSFDQMATAVGRAGGAAEVAGAKTKGLGGAIEGFKSQVETASIGIFEVIGPRLEQGVRAAADVVARATPVVVSGIQSAVTAAEVFGPMLADAIQSRGAVVGSAVRDVLGPLAEAVPGLLNAGINAAIGLWEDFTSILKNVVEAAKPVARGISDIAKSATQAGGPISATGAALGVVGDVAGVLSTVLVPIGKVIGGIASAFAALPGPVQSAVIALGLVAAFRGPLSSLGDTVTNRVITPFKAMGQEVQLQKALLTGSTDIMSAQVGKFGLAMAALEARVPVMQKMRSSFEDAAVGADRFHRSAGLVAAAGTGLKSAVGGVVGALGGPWGLAIAGATLGLGLLASSQQKAAQKAAEHAGWVDNLAQSLRESHGAINENIRANITKRAQDEGALDNAKKLGIAYSDVTTAVIDQGPALDGLRARLQKIVEENTRVQSTAGKGGAANTFLTEQGKVAKDLLGQLDSLAGGFQSAEEKNRRFDEAMASGKAGMLEATDAGRTFSAAMGVLADKTASADDKARALKEGLDALSGGTIDLESSQARLEERLDRLRQGFDEAKFGTKGFVDSLIAADGKFNITTENGRKFRDGLKDITESAAETAQRTFDLTGSVEQAGGVIANAREEFIATATQMGLSATQAGALADSMGLIPENVITLIQTPGMTQAQLELILVRELVNKVPGDKPITVRALSDEAKQKLIDLGFTVRTLPNGDVEVIANTETARGNLDQFVKDANNKTITIQARVAINTAAVSRELRLLAAMGNAQGNIVEHYAGGGLRKLTPMQAGLARIVPPNTWRVVGDRMFDDEAYIPINRSSRSVALLEETAARMGFTLARRFALGGFASSTSGNIVARSGDTTVKVFIDGREFRGIIRTEIDESTRATRRDALAGAGGAR